MTAMIASGEHSTPLTMVWYFTCILGVLHLFSRVDLDVICVLLCVCSKRKCDIMYILWILCVEADAEVSAMWLGGMRCSRASREWAACNPIIYVRMVQLLGSSHVGIFSFLEALKIKSSHVGIFSFLVTLKIKSSCASSLQDHAIAFVGD